MTAWSNDAKQYFEGYLGQVSALLQTSSEDAGETVEDLRQHIIHKAEEAAGSIVTLADIRNVLAVVGTPDQVVGAGYVCGSSARSTPRAGLRSQVIERISSLSLQKVVFICLGVVVANVIVLAVLAVSRLYGPEEHQGGLPEGWFQSGTNQQDYITGLAYGVKGYANQAMFIRAESKKPSGFGTVMNKVPADKFRGRQVTLRSIMKSQNTGGRGGLWLRADDMNGKPLEFKNMQEHPLQDNVDPTEYKVQLDVPASASKIMYGVLLEGGGHVWFEKPELSVTR